MARATLVNNGHSDVFTLVWDGGEQSVIMREVQVDLVSRVALRQAVLATLRNPSADAVFMLQVTLIEVEKEPEAQSRTEARPRKRVVLILTRLHNARK